jgi:hypothetical protein
LYQLPGLVAEAKHRELARSLESRKGKEKGPLRIVKHMRTLVNEPVYAPGAMLNEALDADVPTPLERYTTNFPFGNTHVAIMVGPLIIENGVTK